MSYNNHAQTLDLSKVYFTYSLYAVCFIFCPRNTSLENSLVRGNSVSTVGNHPQATDMSISTIDLLTAMPGLSTISDSVYIDS